MSLAALCLLTSVVLVLLNSSPGPLGTGHQCEVLLPVDWPAVQGLEDMGLWGVPFPRRVVCAEYQGTAQRDLPAQGAA
eukprot:1551574-Lingulodinium_polyedra.AAC.1